MQITREKGVNRSSGTPLQTAGGGPSIKEPVPDDAAVGRSPRPERELRITLAYKALRRISVSRTLYHSARSGGWCIVLRGTRSGWAKERGSSSPPALGWCWGPNG